jgi:hypothetical protein
MDNHIVLIEFNLPQTPPQPIYKGNPCWMQTRLELFENYTLPSFASQTNKDFFLILLCDPNTPKIFKEKLLNYTKQFSFIKIIWTITNGPEINSQILELYNSCRTNNTDTILASRCDNDDSVHVTYIDTIKSTSNQKYKVLSLAKGIFWDTKLNKFLDSDFPTGPFVTTKSTIKEFFNPFSYTHHDMVLKHNSLILKTEYPMWLVLCHGGNQWNRLDRMPGKEVKLNLEDIKPHFGLQ